MQVLKKGPPEWKNPVDFAGSTCEAGDLLSTLGGRAVSGKTRRPFAVGVTLRRYGSELCCRIWNFEITGYLQFTCANCLQHFKKLFLFFPQLNFSAFLIVREAISIHEEIRKGLLLIGVGSCRRIPHRYFGDDWVGKKETGGAKRDSGEGVGAPSLLKVGTAVTCRV